MPTIEKLDYELGFKWDKKKFDSFQKSLGGIVKGFAKLSAGVAVAQGVAFAFAKGVAQSNDDLAKQSKRLNLASEDLQKWQFAAQLGGAANESLASSLKNLTKAQDDVLRGKGDLEAFGQLGINPADFSNSNDLLMAISDSISTIQSDSEKINLLERIGVSGDLLQTLEGGSEAIKKVGREFENLGGIVSKDQQKLAEDFNDNMTKLGTAFGGIKNEVGSALIGPFSEFVVQFTKFVKNNMAELIAGFKRFFEVIQKVAGVVMHIVDRLFRVFSGIVNLMGSFENAVMLVAGAFLILKGNALLAFAVPLAIATALFLVIEDIVRGLQGQDSLFGDLITTLGSVENAILAIVAAFIALKVAMLAVSKLGKAGLGLAGLSGVSDLGGPDKKGVKGGKAGLARKLGKLILPAAVAFEVSKSFGEKLFKGAKSIKEQKAMFQDKKALSPFVPDIKRPEPIGGGQTLKDIMSGFKSSQNVTINVNGTTDPKSVVRAINAEMQRKTNSTFGGK